MVTSSRLVQPLKTPVPTLVAVMGIGLDFNRTQSSNVKRPMFTHEAGKVTDVNSRQPEKAFVAVVVTG